MRSVLRLIRLPNTLTAAADVAAGAALAGLTVASGPVLVVAVGSMALYGAGVCMNDVVDRDKDRVLHPDRPLPAGHVSLQTANLLIAFLAVVALVSGPIGAALSSTAIPTKHLLLLVASSALTFILAVGYNLAHESRIHLSRLLMGATRASNMFRGVLLAWCLQGGTLSDVAPATMALVGHTLLIYFVTAISEHEDSSRATDFHGYRLGIISVVVVLMILGVLKFMSIASVVALTLGCLWCFWTLRPLSLVPPRAGQAVGRLIGSLALYDALLVLAGTESMGWWDAAIIGSLYPVGRILRRLTVFEAS